LTPPDSQTATRETIGQAMPDRPATILARWFRPRSASPFDRLVLFSWRGELLLICAGMLVSFLVAGFWFPYWRVADMDFFVVYNAFLLNTPLPQEFFDHPGYLSILSLSYWLRALHAIGLVHVQAFSAVPPLRDAAGFAEAWTQATRAGRVLSLIYAMAFVLAFSYLLRALVRDWRVAILGGFALAFSGGMAMQMRMLRTELLSAGLFMVALLMLMVAAVRGPRAWRPLVVGAASLLITLALLNKVQVLFLIGALPLLLIFVGPGLDGAKSAPQNGFWDVPSRAWPVFGASVVIAALAVTAAKDIVLTGLTTATAPGLFFTARLHVAQIYWALLAAWLGLGMAAYTIAWRVPPLEALTAAISAVAGCMIGLLALDARYNAANVVAVFHPLEHMAVFAGWANPQLANGSPLDAAHLQFLAQAAAGVLARVTFVLHPSTRPAIFIQWFVIVATVIAIRERKWRLVLPVAALMLSAWAIDTLDMGRGLKQEYFNFTDPLVIIAAALLLANLPVLQNHRWTYAAGVALIAVHVVMSQMEPVKRLIRHDQPEVICDFYAYAARVEKFPTCPKPAQ
jgi:hypothetical protein